MASTQNTFSNPLILRLILLNLPTKDLLLAQQVCRTWHHLIKKSHSLQKSLFLLPDSSAAASGEIIKNDLLATHFPDFFEQNTSSRAHLGPLDSTRWNHNSHGNPAYARSEARWRKLFPTQPPPSELQVLESVAGMGGKRGTFKSMRVEEGQGVRFDIIYDLIQEFLLPFSEGRIDRGAHVEIVGMQSEQERLLPIIRNKLHRSWLESSKARMRKALPDVGFAGEGCVVVYLERTQQCSRGRGPILGQRLFEEDYLRSDAAEGTKKRMKWDVEKGFFVR